VPTLRQGNQDASVNAKLAGSVFAMRPVVPMVGSFHEIHKFLTAFSAHIPVRLASRKLSLTSTEATSVPVQQTSEKASGCGLCKASVFGGRE